jgi:uncharacterized protein (TIGR02246 family)
MRKLTAIMVTSALVALPIAGGQEQPKPAVPGAAAADASRRGQSEDEKAIRAVDEAFVRDYNRGDSKALAAMFTEDAEVIEADGGRYQGRDLVEQSFADTFAASKGAKIAVEIESIRLLSPDAAKEEGRTVVTPTEGAPVSRDYTVIFIKRDGRWLISSVREESDPLVRPHDRLKDLEWMVGDWVEEESESLVRVNCRWSSDGNFLIRSFTVRRQGQPVMTVSQRIGWDPLARQVRSWEFDSEGGFGEGRWSRDGDRWVIKHTGVRPEGTTASATNVMARERPDLVRWVSTGRVVGDELVPEDESFVLVRVPPEPRQKSKGGAAASPTSKAERSPR